jgi:predicted nucleic acid-binding protein
MIFLLDSNAFSDLMRKDPRVEAYLAALGSNDKVMICSIVRGEILYGLARLPQGRRRRFSPALPASPSPNRRETRTRTSNGRASSRV